MLACLMAGGAIAVMGLVGFVGLLVPHMARLLTGSEGRRLLPLSGVLGRGLPHPVRPGGPDALCPL